jgi:hypothetical protein
MFVFFAFVIFHVYLRFLFRSRKKTDCWTASSPDGNSCPPALRHEIANIPEARRFAKRHELLPSGTPEEERAGKIPKPAPVPARWRSIATGSVMPERVRRCGRPRVRVLTAYHTIGGGALTEPYGDLVIFFVPPIFVIAGVVVVLIGMYVQWIRWRMHKPLAFARYPKWDLNLAARERHFWPWRSEPQSSRSRDLWDWPGVSLHGRRVILRRHLPLHDSGVRDLPAVAACARRLCAVPRRTRAPQDTSFQRLAA